MDEPRSGGHIVLGRYPAAKGPGFTEFLGIRCESDDAPCDLVGLRSVTAGLIDAVSFTFAYVDAFTDCRELPAPAESAREALISVGKVQHEARRAESRWYRWLRRKGPTLMGVELDLRNDSQRAIAVEFGPYSIHALIGADDGTGLLLHDSGSAVTLVVRHEDADGVRGLFSSLRVSVEVTDDAT